MRMQQNWILRYSLLIVAATGEALTYKHDTKSSIEVTSSLLGQNPRVRDFVLHEAATPEVVEQKTGYERLLEKTTDPTSIAVKRESPVLRIPRPTATPSLGRRQDDGQIQALSAQLQSLSQSATQAISSVSSSASSILSQMSQSAQSVRQSADQIRQSADQANQAADQASRQLSQTESSASSAVSAASARASDQISQSLVSMTSRISANLASVQSSASDAISSARVAASQFAASKIQAAQAATNGVGGGANSSVGQALPGSVSPAVLAVAIIVSIIGTAILSVLSTFLLLRYRRKKKPDREDNPPENNERTYEKPVAVRGTLSPRFPRFSRGIRTTIDEFKLPSLSPLLRSMKARRETRNITSSAASGYTDEDEDEENMSSNRDASEDSGGPSMFRLQKDAGVTSATAVRLIRVGSDKSRARSSMDIQQTITESIPPLPMVAVPYESLRRVPVPSHYEPTIQPSSQIDTTVTQPPKSREPVSARSTGNFDTGSPGWRPSVRLTTTDPNRFRFRDSSDLESGEPTPTKVDVSRSSSTSHIPSIRSSRTTSGPWPSNRGTIPPGQPKNGRGTFATFPRIRTDLVKERESVMSRGRPNRGERRSEGPGR
ncbi:hypothetical protein F4803DRAFT_25593 [Xylaria telfairii]|nr:hypothetical protein F4803DRAFT_25593 [Xylaria telfairii]